MQLDHLNAEWVRHPRAHVDDLTALHQKLDMPAPLPHR
jgi:hypothetical protein